MSISLHIHIKIIWFLKLITQICYAGRCLIAFGFRNESRNKFGFRKTPNEIITNRITWSPIIGIVILAFLIVAFDCYFKVLKKEKKNPMRKSMTRFHLRVLIEIEYVIILNTRKFCQL